MKTTDLAVIGAGPAGLAAAVMAARAGVRVTLLDEYPLPGGQYLKGAQRKEIAPAASKTELQARELLERLPSQNIDLLTGTLVWGIEGYRLALHGEQGTDWLTAKKIIIAAGARELVTPFPGWTLPGVMTLGAAQILAKEHQVVPGKRILLAGSGPLLLATANTLSNVDRDACIIGLYETAHPQLNWIYHLPTLRGNIDRIREAWQYAKLLFQNRVPYRFGHTVIRAEGKDGLTGVVVARVNRMGKPVTGSEKYIELDTLCIGSGFVPNTELTQLAGCAHEYLPDRGGWVAVTDERFQTSSSDIYAIGEITGISGAKTALIQGQIAGLAVAHELGMSSEDDFIQSYLPLKRQLQPLRRFSNMLNTLFTPTFALDSLITDEITICLCERVRAGEIRQAIRQGAKTLNDLKDWVPVGQGHCQGRTCGPILARLISSETGMTASAIGQFQPRPPLKPITLGVLADLPTEDIQ